MISIADRCWTKTALAARAGRLTTAVCAAALATLAPAPAGAAGPPLWALGPGAVPAASPNWAGYAALGAPGTFTRVTATWTQPEVGCESGAESAVLAWVGLDGLRSPALEQAGSAAVCSAGRAEHFAWFEILPAPLVRIGDAQMRVRPGDRLTTTVSLADRSTGAIRFELFNHRSRQSFSTTGRSPMADGSSAEWVVERPAIAPPPAPAFLPLADFERVRFSAAGAGNADHFGAVGDPAWHPLVAITMLGGPTGPVLAAPSALPAGGSRFSVSRPESENEQD